MQEKHPDVSFVKVNTEDPALKELAKEHVKVLPTFKFFKARPFILIPGADGCAGRQGATGGFLF